MHISIIIPAHNEGNYLRECLNSFVAQTRRPDELILVDDNSTDTTYAIATKFAQDHAWIKAIKHQSSDEHLPGPKVIHAFTYGLHHSSRLHDIIGKFDADIILPNTYFEQMEHYFTTNPNLGMCSGLLYIKKNDEWAYEAIASTDHIRGPIKLYTRKLFEQMGGLRPGVGWDTVDVLLCQFHGFCTKTDSTLWVKHLRPTGQGYQNKKYGTKGEALYKMRYGLPLAGIALLKMAFKANSATLVFQAMTAYVVASAKGVPRFVTVTEGKFIRKLRWRGVFDKIKRE